MPSVDDIITRVHDAVVGGDDYLDHYAAVADAIRHGPDGHAWSSPAATLNVEVCHECGSRFAHDGESMEMYTSR